MQIFADLHIHIGRTTRGKAVKITAADSLTVENILYEAAIRKGIQLVGIVDAGSPGVQEDLEHLISTGTLVPLDGGGLRYKDSVTLIPGMEVETGEAQGAGHFVVYFPQMSLIKDFSEKLFTYITNIQLSTQKARLNLTQLWDLAQGFGGLVIPAHIFTQHKSLYGSCSDSIHELLSSTQVTNLKAVELGLSSDTELAQLIGELNGISFLSNSDAHSLPKIGREYNLLELKDPDFISFLHALENRNDCRILANFGLDPKLGKYHRTFCEQCQAVVKTPPPTFTCPKCGSNKVTKGVLDRITQLSSPGNNSDRPPYIHQVPLQFLPGLGPKTLELLLRNFGTEMNVLHYVDQEDLTKVAGEQLSKLILSSRYGTLEVAAGGGGIYGKVLKE
jgi:uncharacterized protein (TIGR00375 family)